jgi:DNA polymerase-3 subunit delta
MAALKPEALKTSFHGSSVRYPGALLFGPNWDLANRLKTDFVSWFRAREIDGEVICLSDIDIASDAGVLLEQLQSISLFGSKKLVVLEANSSISQKACIAAVSIGWSDCILLVVCGDLKKSSALRKEFEASPTLAAVACYEQTSSELSDIAKIFLNNEGVNVDKDGIDKLVAAVEGNAALLQSELEKLVTYAGRQRELTQSDVGEIIAISDSTSLDTIVDALFSGNTDLALGIMASMKTENRNPATIFSALINHCALLLAMSAEIGLGNTPDRIVKGWRPVIFWKRQGTIIGHLKNIRHQKLLTVSARLHNASLEARQNHQLAWPLVERFILASSQALRHQ